MKLYRNREEQMLMKGVMSVWIISHGAMIVLKELFSLWKIQIKIKELDWFLQGNNRKKEKYKQIKWTIFKRIKYAMYRSEKVDKKVKW
jgi:hypothetical protein